MKIGDRVVVTKGVREFHHGTIAEVHPDRPYSLLVRFDDGVGAALFQPFAVRLLDAVEALAWLR